jgi:hypothetical protein
MGWLLLGRAAGVGRVVCSLLIVTFLDVDFSYSRQ